MIETRKLFKMLSVVIAFAAWLGVCPGPIAAQDITVSVKPMADVNNDDIVLGDVAFITGPECALKEDLARIYITRSPKPGDNQTIRQNYLEYRLRSSGLPLDQVDVRIPEKMTVHRLSQNIDEAWVRSIIEEYLSGIEPYRNGHWELVSLNLGTLPVLPAGDLDYRISPNKTNTPARMSARVFLFVNDEQAGHIRVSGQINVAVQAVIPVRRLEQGHFIKPGDVKKVELDQSLVLKGALTEPNQAYGLTARRRLLPGQPIRSTQLVRRPIVHRGDRVTIVAESSQVRVTAPGQAKEDGAIDENISVLNLSSKKVISAKVLNQGVVVVNF